MVNNGLSHHFPWLTLDTVNLLLRHAGRQPECLADDCRYWWCWLCWGWWLGSWGIAETSGRSRLETKSGRWSRGAWAEGRWWQEMLINYFWGMWKQPCLILFDVSSMFVFGLTSATSVHGGGMKPMQSTSWKCLLCSPVSINQHLIRSTSRQWRSQRFFLTVFMCQVYFADFLNQRLRKLVKSGDDWYIYTVAGTGVSWPIAGLVQNCLSILFKQQLLFSSVRIDIESNPTERSEALVKCPEIMYRSDLWVISVSVCDEQVMATDDSCDTGCVPLLAKTTLGFAIWRAAVSIR